MADRTRQDDDELSPGIRAQLVRARRSANGSLKLTIPIAAITAVGGLWGYDAMKSSARSDTQQTSQLELRVKDVEQRAASNAMDNAVIRSEQQSIKESLQRIEAILENMRQRDERARR